VLVMRIHTIRNFTVGLEPFIDSFKDLNIKFDTEVLFNLLF
jgi:hypothetical protein